MQKNAHRNKTSNQLENLSTNAESMNPAWCKWPKMSCQLIRERLG